MSPVLEFLGEAVPVVATGLLIVVLAFGLFELVCALFVDPWRRWRDASDRLRREREARAWQDAFLAFRDDDVQVQGRARPGS